MNSKYKIGDKFDCVLEICDVEEDSDGNYFYFKVHDSDIYLESGYLSAQEIDEAFDPTYKARLKQKRIAELEAELEELKNEDVRGG